MKIFIDTNIYLDFYRSNKEGLRLLEELEGHFESIILTDQVILEFERNREKVIQSVQKVLEVESKIEDFKSSFLHDLEEFRGLINIQKTYKEKRSEINEIITAVLKDPSKDKIASFFKNFVDESIRKKSILYADDEIIKLAQKRKLIGNPPGSEMFSLGDEINWETILKLVREDTIIVSRDATYKDNFTFLSKDFRRSTGHSIVALTDKITMALKVIGANPGGKLMAAENSIIESIKHYSEFWKRNDVNESINQV